jgi:hypothetical protein
MEAIDALQGAIEMLMEIRCGGSFNPTEYERRLSAYKRALAAHRAKEAANAKWRVGFLKLAERRRLERAA